VPNQIKDVCVEMPKEKYVDECKEVLDEEYSVVLDRECNIVDNHKATATKYMVSRELDFSITSHSRLVVLFSKNGPDIYIHMERTGSFSVMLPRDTYSLSIRATHVDEKMGIVFIPIPKTSVSQTSPSATCIFSLST
jgi:hypothetical protein